MVCFYFYYRFNALYLIPFKIWDRDGAAGNRGKTSQPLVHRLMRQKSTDWSKRLYYKCNIIYSVFSFTRGKPYNTHGKTNMLISTVVSDQYAFFRNTVTDLFRLLFHNPRLFNELWGCDDARAVNKTGKSLHVSHFNMAHFISVKKYKKKKTKNKSSEQPWGLKVNRPVWRKWSLWYYSSNLL